MNSFPAYLKPGEEFKPYLIQNYLSLLRKEIYDFIIKEEYIKDFYDLEAFFTTYEIKDKDEYVTTIVKELKINKWLVAQLFGGSAIAIFSCKKAIEKSIWKQQLDFQLL